jgi:hypothetical protein
LAIKAALPVSAQWFWAYHFGVWGRFPSRGFCGYTIVVIWGSVLLDVFVSITLLPTWKGDWGLTLQIGLCFSYWIQATNGDRSLFTFYRLSLYPLFSAPVQTSALLLRSNKQTHL